MFGSTDNTMSNTPDSGNNASSNSTPPTGNCLSTTPISKKVIIGSITIVILVIIAIVLGVTLSSNNNNDNVDPPGFQAEGGVAINDTTKSPSTTTSSNDNNPSSSPTSLRGLPTEIIPTSTTVEMNDETSTVYSSSSSPVVSTATPPSSSSSSTIIESSPSTPTESTPPTPCIDTPNYKDKYNSPCSDYSLPANKLWCGAYGNDSVLNDGSDTPNVNCCVCKLALLDKLALLEEEEEEEEEEEINDDGESVPWGEDDFIDNTSGSSSTTTSSCKLCPNGIAADYENYIPFENDTQTCQELIDNTATWWYNEDYDESCELSNYVQLFCCPDDFAQQAQAGEFVGDNSCTICPNGITNGEDYTPFIADGDTTTCKALVDEVNFFGSDFCDGTSIYEMLCCPSEDREPCTLCPNGITVGDDYVPTDFGGNSCKELVDLTALTLTKDDESCEGSKIIEVYCCPTVQENPCLICPNGLSVEKEEFEFADDGTTCKEIVDFYMALDANSGLCLEALGAVAEEEINPCCPSSSGGSAASTDSSGTTTNVVTTPLVQPTNKPVVTAGSLVVVTDDNSVPTSNQPTSKPVIVADGSPAMQPEQPVATSPVSTSPSKRPIESTVVGNDSITKPPTSKPVISPQSTTPPPTTPNNNPTNPQAQPGSPVTPSPTSKISTTNPTTRQPTNPPVAGKFYPNCTVFFFLFRMLIFSFYSSCRSNSQPDALTITTAYYNETSHAGEYEYRLSLCCSNSFLWIISDSSSCVISLSLIYSLQ